MLLLLIPTAWIALAAFFVALGAMAGRGDDALALFEEPARVRTSLGDLVVWERAPLVAARLGDQSFEHSPPFEHSPSVEHSSSGIGGAAADSSHVALRARSARRAGRCASSRS